MPKYAVKLGEIHLKSDTPISQKERSEAIELMKEAARETLGGQVEGLEIEFIPAS